MLRLQRKLAAVLERVATHLPIRRIHGSDAGDVYLERYYVCGRQPPDAFGPIATVLGWLPWVVYLHRFRRSDDDRELHNHPFDMGVVVLTGGYFEELPTMALATDEHPRPTRLVWRGAGSVRRLRRDTFHRVLLPSEPDAPTWTLVVCGPKRQRWGFVDIATGAYTDAHDRFGG
jgi:hypothetical protein